MAIFKRGKFFWYEFTFNGQRIRESTKQGSRRDAHDLEAARRTQLAKIAKGLESAEPVTPVADPTVAELLDGLRLHYESDKRKQLSPGIVSTIKQARAEFGKLKACDLTPEHIRRYISERQKKGKRNATINRVLETVRRAYHVGDVKPPTKIQHLSEKGNARTGFYSNEEFRRLLANLPADLQDFCLFAYLTGWRKGECASLTWADVEGDTIYLRAEHSKNGEPRKVPILGELVGLIARRRAARIASGILTARVFFRANGSPVGEFRKPWRHAVAAAELRKDSRFHDFRRCAARNMIRKGISQTVAMKITGHKTVSMFQRYNITSDDDLRDAMAKISEAYAEASEKVVSL